MVIKKEITKIKWNLLRINHKLQSGSKTLHSIVNNHHNRQHSTKEKIKTKLPCL